MNEHHLKFLASPDWATWLDVALYSALAARMEGTNVDVVHGDAMSTGLPANRFTTAACFAMLHHVPAVEMQDRVFAEMHRVLRPGGIFLGTDSVDSDAIREFHVDDVFVPLPPDELEPRLEVAGFRDVDVHVGDFELRFKATK